MDSWVPGEPHPSSTEVAPGPNEGGCVSPFRLPEVTSLKGVSKSVLGNSDFCRQLPGSPRSRNERCRLFVFHVETRNLVQQMAEFG